MNTPVDRYYFDLEDTLAKLFDVVPSHRSFEIRVLDGELIVDFVIPERAYADDEAEANPADQQQDDDDESDAEEKPPNLPADEQTDPQDEERGVEGGENAQAATPGRKEQEARDFLATETLLWVFFDCDNYPGPIEKACIAAINKKLHERLHVDSLALLDERKGAYMAFVDVRGEFIAWRDE